MQVDLDPDSDLDMADSQPPDSPVWTKGDSSPMLSPTTRPSFRASHLPNEKTRIPTPIYGHFSLQDPLKIAMSAASDSTFPYNSSTKNSLSIQSSVSASQAHPLFFNRRSLPSPISEDESMESPTTMTGTMLHRLNMNHNTFPKPSPAFEDKNSNAMEINEPTPANSPSECTMAEAPTPFHHASQNQNIRDSRRGAIAHINAIPLTHQQPRGKTVLSMGFRADCEKCRERVPGHWSHVLRV